MRRFALLAVATVLGMTASCGGKSGSQGQLSAPSAQMKAAATNNDPSLPERQKRYDEWMGAASMVAAQSGDSSAQDMVDKVGAAASVGIPVGSTVKVDARGKSDLLVVIPLIAADASINQLYAQIENGDPPTYYMSPVALVLGDPESFSPVWRGLAMISVMRQALGPEQGSNVDNSRSDIEYVLGLAAKMSPEFTSAVADEQVRLGSEFDAMGKIVSATAPYPPSFDMAFGPPASEQERELRAAEVWDGAVFGLLQERYGADANAKKDAFLIAAAGQSPTQPHG